MKKLIAAILLSLVLVSPANAGFNNDTITMYVMERVTRDPVDVQTWCGDCPGVDYTTGSPWTINPGWVDGYTPPIIAPTDGSSIETGCMWDSDDYFTYQSRGNVLNANTTLSMTECRWSPQLGGGGFFNRVNWTSASPDLNITYRWDWSSGSKSFTLPKPVRAGTAWNYQVCFYSADGFGEAISVPGSHDGVGNYQLETITVSNPTNKKVNKTGGLITSDFRGNASFCPNGILMI